MCSVGIRIPAVRATCTNDLNAGGGSPRAKAGCDRWAASSIATCVSLACARSKAVARWRARGKVRMSRKRIHELAKEWNVDVKDFVARLDKLGIRNKRAQSSLTDEEVERARAELAIDERPAVAVGDERVAVDTEGHTVVERRVRTNVIRRRTTRADSVPGLETAFPEGATLPPLSGEPFEVPADLFETTFAPELLPEAPLSSFSATEPPQYAPQTAVSGQAAGSESAAPVEAHAPAAMAADVAASAPVVPRMVPPPPPPPVARPAAPKARVEAPELQSPFAQRGPKVIGRIDLRKTQPAPAPAAPPRQRHTATAEPPPPMAPPAEDAKPKRKKRKVIKQTDMRETVDQDRRFGRPPRKKKALPGKEIRKTEITTPRASKRVVRISEVITVGDLARAMGVKAGEVIKKLMDSGMMAAINQVLDYDTAAYIASEFEYIVENVAFDAESMLEEKVEKVAVDEGLQTRPPVVTIMGHVDHGKTSLLDAIRHTNVTAGEAGGITQHIGAYSVDVDERRVTFLDTPGHEAFTAMRARGAKVTDIVVLVVAADDGVMPQTVEAINHARAAGVPIVVAINKIDKPEANLERIKQQLADYGLVAEDWGGDTVCVPVSARSKQGIPQLLEMLLLQADILDLKANPTKLAKGIIVEARLDRGRGPVATVLVQEGTLKVSDPFVCGWHYGRIRAMVDERGRKVHAAAPAEPVEILGLTGVPEAGTSLVAVADEATARQVAEHRRGKQREADLVKTAKISLDELYQQIQAGDVKELRLVLKADVQGSVEALSEALSRLSSDEVRLNVLHASVGGITESDVLLASASNAVVIGFNVRPEAKANDVADREGVDVRLYTVIYDVINDVRDAMEGLLEPAFRERVLGRAEVRQVFTVPSVGSVGGSFITDGKVVRNGLARLVRDHVVVYTGKVSSLRRFKDDAREVQAGYECGIGLENYQDMKVGDVIETFELEKVQRRLAPAAGRGAPVERRA